MPRPEDDFADSDPAGRDHPPSPSVCLDPTTGFSADSTWPEKPWHGPPPEFAITDEAEAADVHVDPTAEARGRKLLGLDPEEFTTPEDAIPKAVTPEKSEYQKLAEHLSVLGMERERFVRSRETATTFGIDHHPMEGMMRYLLRGQAEIMGALALFARDYDPELYVHTTTSSDTVFGGVSVEPGSVLDAVTRNMDRSRLSLDDLDLPTLDNLDLPEPTRGHRWALWTGAGPSATPGVVERPAGLPEDTGGPFRPNRPAVRVRLRDGRVSTLRVGDATWKHVGSDSDILAYEEPIKPG